MDVGGSANLHIRYRNPMEGPQKARNKFTHRSSSITSQHNPKELHIPLQKYLLMVCLLLPYSQYSGTEIIMYVHHLVNR